MIVNFVLTFLTTGKKDKMMGRFWVFLYLKKGLLEQKSYICNSANMLSRVESRCQNGPPTVLVILFTLSNIIAS